MKGNNKSQMRKQTCQILITKNMEIHEEKKLWRFYRKVVKLYFFAQIKIKVMLSTCTVALFDGHSLGFHLNGPILQTGIHSPNQWFVITLCSIINCTMVSYFRISSTDSKFKSTLHSTINNTTGKYCLVAFI